MNLIPSFSIDHRKLKPGLYVSRIDKTGDTWATTFDVRMKRPNVEPAIHPNAMHTIEHVVATYLRNSEFSDKVVYWGPMGCLTGFYLIVNTEREMRPSALAPLLRRAFRHMADYEGEVPGATPANCGNWLLHDLPMAKWEAARFLERKWEYRYPKTPRAKAAGGMAFYDA